MCVCVCVCVCVLQFRCSSDIRSLQFNNEGLELEVDRTMLTQVVGLMSYFESVFCVHDVHCCALIFACHKVSIHLFVCPSHYLIRDAVSQWLNLASKFVPT